jgi:hypothetical protein
MPLAQVIINHDVGNNGSMFLLPMVGKCSIRILSIQTHGAQQHSFLQLRSDILQLQMSGSPYFTWYVEPQAVLSVDSSHQAYHFNNINVQGKMYIEVCELDGSRPANLDCVITMSIEKLNE